MTLDHTQRTFIAEIKEKISLAQYEAPKAVNTSLIRLYWDIGHDVSERQGESWGQSIVPVLSAELQKEFPGISGFSVSNLWSMSGQIGVVLSPSGSGKFTLMNTTNWRPIEGRVFGRQQ
jgi:hypothetical protein